MKIAKRHISAFLCAALAVGVMLGFKQEPSITANAKTNSEIQSEINALNSRMNNVTKEQTALKNQINSAKVAESNVISEITNLTHEIDLIDQQILIIDSLLVQYDELTAQQEIEIFDLQAKIEKEKQILDEMIRLSFEYSSTGSAIEFIFSAESFTDLISRVDLLEYHLSYNDKVIENYNNSLTELENTKASYEQAKATMSEYRTEQLALSDELEAKKSDAEAKRNQLSVDIELYEQNLAEKQKYVNQLDSEIKALAAMFAKEDKSTYSGTFCFPIPTNVYRITSYYGNRTDPFTGKTAYHSGYDLACSKGTEIYAADSGTVVIAAWNGGYGNCVTINHGGGIMTLYGHCSELLVKSGDTVKRGQVIAKVGSTGRSTGNHLHFEVRKNGSVIDPAPFIGL